MDNSNRNYAFNELISRINSFSHAYLIKCDSMKNSYPQILKLVKKIVCNEHKNEENKCDCNICHLIDKNIFDDYILINPDSIAIKSEELDLLMKKLETKSIRDNGNRVYLIFGIERLHNDISNKILKFLEEPPENTYAIILTEHIDKVLPTIISRCQLFNYFANSNENDEKDYNNIIEFIKFGLKEKNKIIAYENYYFEQELKSRELMDESLYNIENILINNINKRNSISFDEKLIIDELQELDINKIIDMLNVTTKKRNLVNKNINLNLMLDRYIIELFEE